MINHVLVSEVACANMESTTICKDCLNTLSYCNSDIMLDMMTTSEVNPIWLPTIYEVVQGGTITTMSFKEAFYNHLDYKNKSIDKFHIAPERVIFYNVITIDDMRNNGSTLIKFRCNYCCQDKAYSSKDFQKKETA